MVSLRKTDKKETTKIIDEPKIDDDPKEKIVENNEIKEEVPVESKIENEDIKETENIPEQSLEQSIFEKTTIIPLDEIEKPVSREENIAQAGENVEKEQPIKKYTKSSRQKDETSVYSPVRTPSSHTLYLGKSVATFAFVAIFLINFEPTSPTSNIGQGLGFF